LQEIVEQFRETHISRTATSREGKRGSFIAHQVIHEGDESTVDISKALQTNDHSSKALIKTDNQLSQEFMTPKVQKQSVFHGRNRSLLLANSSQIIAEVGDERSTFVRTNKQGKGMY